MTDDDDLERLRVLLRAMLGQPEPEPQHGKNHVPHEGTNPKHPGISPDQHRRDFLRRLTGEIPAYAEQLPTEQDT